MKVKEMIESLKDFNPDAEFGIVTRNIFVPMEEKYYAWGTSEGCIKQNCENVCIYVDSTEDIKK